ncbi:ATP-binding cassette domain-containing protein [Nostocoides sp. HKS02]|nr:ATP-binding cassette domain-containing protein [Tetrasphaera sp. HKS02]
MDRQPLVRASGITKRFGAITALEDVTVEFRRGEVHGLVGANGAGKSTLIKILAGAHLPDSGAIEIDGSPVTLRSTSDSQRLGLGFIYQELSLVPKFSILQNLAMGHWETSPAGLLRWAGLRARAKEVLGMIGLEKPLDFPAERLSVADAWLVSIARALMSDTRLIAMDEPSASLSAEECERLFAVVRSLGASGVCVLYVSHRLNEVVELCDRVTVFRDGRVVDILTGSAIDRPALVKGIVGGRSVPVAADEPAAALPDGQGPVLSLRGLRRAPLVHGVDLDLMPGEVVGLTGLVGSGRTEVARMVFGADRPDGGEMRIDGRPYRPRSVVEAIRHGVALVPEERRSQGLFLDKSIDFNVALPTLKSIRGPLRLLSTRKRVERSQAMVRSLDIKTRSTDTLVRQLSGGNQQKVVMAKWLVDGCRVLLLDEPSRGVDVSARAEIYRVIRQQAATGTAVLVISSEFEELKSCDRVVVMREGRITANLTPSQASESVVLEASFADHHQGQPHSITMEPQ